MKTYTVILWIAPKAAIRECRPRPVTWRVDKYRNTGREQKAVGTCRCDHYSHPHAKGRGWCIHNTKITIEALEQRSTWS